VYRKQFWLIIAMSLISGKLLIRAKTYALAELELSPEPERPMRRRRAVDVATAET
jgi:hypothetical protein